MPHLVKSVLPIKEPGTRHASFEWHAVRQRCPMILSPTHPPDHFVPTMALANPTERLFC
jgi:hypothetical protein